MTGEVDSRGDSGVARFGSDNGRDTPNRCKAGLDGRAVGFSDRREPLEGEFIRQDRCPECPERTKDAVRFSDRLRRQSSLTAYGLRRRVRHNVSIREGNNSSMADVS